MGYAAAEFQQTCIHRNPCLHNCCQEAANPAPAKLQLKPGAVGYGAGGALIPRLAPRVNELG
jgi:hypothetical protein